MQLRFRFRSYIMHRESVPWYLVVTLPQAILKHRNLLSCILVQLWCRIYMHTVTCFPVSWCSFASSCTYTLEPTHGYPGAALFPTLCIMYSQVGILPTYILIFCPLTSYTINYFSHLLGSNPPSAVYGITILAFHEQVICSLTGYSVSLTSSIIFSKTHLLNNKFK